MKMWLAVALAMFLADVAWTMYFIAVESKFAARAGAWSALIILFGAFSTVSYVHDIRLLPAALIGAFLGTFVTVKFKAKT